VLPAGARFYYPAFHTGLGTDRSLEGSRHPSGGRADRDRSYFEKYRKRPQRFRKVNSLAYCSQEVLRAAEEAGRADTNIGREKQSEMKISLRRTTYQFPSSATPKPLKARRGRSRPRAKTFWRRISARPQKRLGESPQATRPRMPIPKPLSVN